MSEFSYDALKKGTLAEYKKNIIKTLKKGKTTAGVIFVKFQRENKPKKVSVFAPYLKPTQAKEACASVVKEGLHPKKFIACVSVTAYDSTKSDEYINGEITLTVLTSKGSLDGAKILKLAEQSFKTDIGMKLTVIGASETIDDTDTDTDVSSVTDTVTEENTIKELRKEFQEAKNQSKQISKADPKTRVTLIEDTWNKLEVLMPKLAEFISNSEKEGQKQTATKITEAAKTIQATLKPHIEKIKASGNKSPEVSDTKKTEKSNANLDTLTSGISKKAAQLLAKYQQEIADFDQSSDDLAGDSLADKLKSISQIA